MLKQSPKQKARSEKFKKLGAAISRFVADPQVGICLAHPWAVRKSDGFDVLQITTEIRQSKLEMRSEMESECIG